MPSAENCDTVFTWKQRATLGERLDVMHMKLALAGTCQMREGALSVVGKDARAVIPPGRGVVQLVHFDSLVCRIASMSEGETLSSRWSVDPGR